MKIIKEHERIRFFRIQHDSKTGSRSNSTSSIDSNCKSFPYSPPSPQKSPKTTQITQKTQ
jgi:hypothetical protein